MRQPSTLAGYKTQPLPEQRLPVIVPVMKRNTLLAVLAGLLILGMWTVVQGHAAASTKAPHAMWTIFLVLLPAGLAAMALRNVHWAAMGCVIYGTVGFALDVATVVQVISKTSDLFPALLLSGISGFL